MSYPSDYFSPLNHGHPRFLDLENNPNVHTVYVGNVSLDVTCKDYFSFFGRCGKIVWVDVKSGFGFVHYGHPDSAREAIDYLHNTYWFGRNIRVEERGSLVSSSSSVSHERASSWSTSLAPTKDGPNTSMAIHFDKHFDIFLDNLFRSAFDHYPNKPETITPSESRAFRAAFTSPDANIADNGSTGSWIDCYEQGESIMQHLTQEMVDDMQCACKLAKESLESVQCSACIKEIERMMDKRHVARFARRLGLEHWIYGIKANQDQELFYVSAGIVSVLLDIRGISAARIWLRPWLKNMSQDSVVFH